MLRDQYITIRVNQSEKEAIHNLAKAAGMEISDFVRSRLISSNGDDGGALRKYERELLNYAMNSTLLLRRLLYDSGQYEGKTNSNDAVVKDINEQVKTHIKNSYPNNI